MFVIIYTSYLKDNNNTFLNKKMFSQFLLGWCAQIQMIVMKNNTVLHIEQYDIKEHGRVYYTYKRNELIQ